MTGSPKFPEWLTAARESQVTEKGEPWTQDYLIDVMKAETGWAPYRPNYSKYETGRTTPKRATRERFVAFWKTRGIEAPDFDAPEPAPAPVPDLADALMALAIELKAIREERVEYQARLRAVEAEVLSLRAVQESGASATQSAPQESAGSGQ